MKINCGIDDRIKNHERLNNILAESLGDIDSDSGLYTSVSGIDLISARNRCLMDCFQIKYRDKYLSGKYSSLQRDGYQTLILNKDNVDFSLLQSYPFLSDEGIYANPTTATLIIRSNLLRVLSDYLYELTGFPMIAFNHYIGTKVSKTTDTNDAWHYDNQYDPCVLKCLVYINEQTRYLGGTDLLSADKSYDLSNKTGYLGLMCQRSYQSKILPNNIEFTSIVPKTDFTALFFHPSRVLHRGIPPISGTRSIISFSFMPIDACMISKQAADDISITLIKQLASRMMTLDLIPFFQKS